MLATRMLSVGAGVPLIEVLTALSLTTNLKVCLDAGDVVSYDGSAQDWTDRSGNIGSDEFQLGATDQATTDDPLFNGTAGGLSVAEYFSYDGGDHFLYPSTIETWADALHKDSAIFSVFAVVYRVAASSSVHTLFATKDGSAGERGFLIEISTTDKLSIFGADGSATDINVASDTAIDLDAWNAIGWSITEGGGDASFFWDNGAYNQVSSSDTFDAAYTTPSASSAAGAGVIGARDGPTAQAESGERIACLAIWQGTALTKANLDAIYAQIRGRFGI